MIEPASSQVNARRILVVDDDAVTRLLIVHHLKRNNFDVIAAKGVEEAKSAVRTNSSPALAAVVTDYLMPDGTGLELIEWLKTEDASIATIVVTSIGERDLVKRSLRGGACDFLDKPVQIAALLQSVRNAVEYTDRARHLKNTESDVQEVARFQQFMLGTRLDGLPAAVETCWHPIHPVGGDLVNVIPIDGHRLLLLAADVSGHDLKAGFISAYFQGVVRGMVAKGTAIEEVFTYFNRFLISEWSRSQDSQYRSDSVSASISACALVVDFARQKLTTFNSGFPIPVHASESGEAEPCSHEPGFPLGWFADNPVDVSERELAGKGAVYIWTDGLEDLAGSLGVNPLAVAAELIAARRQARTPECLKKANDDILLVRLNLGGLTTGYTIGPANPLPDITAPVIYQRLFAGQDDQLDDFQATWERSLRLAVPSLPEDRLFDVLLCSREAVINAIRYGCQGPGAESSTLQVSWNPHTSTVRVVVSDDGPGHDFQWSTHVKDAADKLIDSHRGLALIHQVPTATRTDRRGSLVTMDFAVRGP